MRGDITQHLIETDICTDELVGQAGIPVIDVPLPRWRYNGGRVI
ncbi:hypothetical protein [Nocardia seriolae]|nr:hypothetical protein [Nocardia seriolae]WNJ55808.1 hypothetical protein RMO66_19915 [Nocardia seriolae]BAW07184.1 hypothetical protein NSERUTF1_4033 [Nocardia seriolae]